MDCVFRDMLGNANDIYRQYLLDVRPICNAWLDGKQGYVPKPEKSDGDWLQQPSYQEKKNGRKKLSLSILVLPCFYWVIRMKWWGVADDVLPFV